MAYQFIFRNSWSSGYIICSLFTHPPHSANTFRIPVDISRLTWCAIMIVANNFVHQWVLFLVCSVELFGKNFGKISKFKAVKNFIPLQIFERYSSICWLVYSNVVTIANVSDRSRWMTITHFNGLLVIFLSDLQLSPQINFPCPDYWFLSYFLIIIRIKICTI